MRRAVTLAAATALCGATMLLAQAQSPRTHELPLKPESVHWGYYDARLAPVLRIASGDRLRVETMVAGGLQRLRLAGVSDADIPDSLKAVEQRVTERGPGAHPMSGPIFVEGAQPGDTLEIRILAIEFLHPFGVNAFSPGGGVLPDEYPIAPSAYVERRARKARRDPEIFKILKSKILKSEILKSSDSQILKS